MLPGRKFTGGYDKRPYLSLLLRLFLETIAIRIQISVFANNWKLKLRPEVSHHLAKATQVHSPLVFRQCSNDTICSVESRAYAFVGSHKLLRG